MFGDDDHGAASADAATGAGLDDDEFLLGESRRSVAEPHGQRRAGARRLAQRPLPHRPSRPPALADTSGIAAVYEQLASTRPHGLGESPPQPAPSRVATVTTGSAVAHRCRPAAPSTPPARGGTHARRISRLTLRGLSGGEEVRERAAAVAATGAVPVPAVFLVWTVGPPPHAAAICGTG